MAKHIVNIFAYISVFNVFTFQVNVATQCDPDEIIVLSDSEGS